MPDTITTTLNGNNGFNSPGKYFYAPTKPRPASIERSGCPYMCTSVRPSVVDQVKIFVQGSISRPINGSKLIYHLRMHLYQPAGMKEPWPHYLYFKFPCIRTLARLSRLRFLVES